MAVVYNPYGGMVFSAVAGQGAYMNGEKIMSSEAGCSVTDIEGNPLSYTGASSTLCMGRGIKEIPDCFRN